MLDIKNIHKIQNYIFNNGFNVTKIVEDASSYVFCIEREIKIYNPNTFGPIIKTYQTEVALSRTKDISNGRYKLIDSYGNHNFIATTEIKMINLFLSKFEQFVLSTPID